MKYTLCNGAYANVQILLKVKGNFISRVQCLEFWRAFWKKINECIHISIHFFCNYPKICIHFKLQAQKKNPTHWTCSMGIQLFRELFESHYCLCQTENWWLFLTIKIAQFGIWTATIPPTPWSRVHQPVSKTKCSIKSFIVSNKSLYFDIRSHGCWREWFHVCLKRLSCETPAALVYENLMYYKRCTRMILGRTKNTFNLSLVHRIKIYLLEVCLVKFVCLWDSAEKKNLRPI